MLPNKDEVVQKTAYRPTPFPPVSPTNVEGLSRCDLLQPRLVCFMKATLSLRSRPLVLSSCIIFNITSIMDLHWAARACSRLLFLKLLPFIWPQDTSDVKDRLSLEYPKDDHLEYPKDVHLDFLTATVADLRQLLAHGKVSSSDLVKGYLKQIDKHNHKGMWLNAVISIAPEEDILWQADALDQERAEGKIRGPMHGIPVIIKVSDVFISTLYKT